MNINWCSQPSKFRELEAWDDLQQVAECLRHELTDPSRRAEIPGPQGQMFRKLISAGYWILYRWMSAEEVKSFCPGYRLAAFVIKASRFWDR